MALKRKGSGYDNPTAYKAIRNIEKEKRKMTGNEYQRLAGRTINKSLTYEGQSNHALHGMVGEIGELHSLYQKKYQGHEFDAVHAKKE